MKSRIGVVAWAAAVAVLASAPHSGVAQEPDILGAKALFYNTTGQVTGVATSDPKAGAVAAAPAAADAKAPPKVAAKPAAPALALRATVLLVTDGGGTREVKPSYKFKSNDRIKLAFTASKTGYFYLATVGPTGRAQILSPRANEAAILEAGYRYVFPTSPSAYFRFDTNPGKEELWALLSDDPLNAVNMGSGQIVEVPAPPGQQRMQVAMASKSVAVPDVTDDLGRKDLLFEEDSNAVYVAAKPLVRPVAGSAAADAGKPPVILKVVLSHD